MQEVDVYKIIFYKEDDGVEPVKEFILSLKTKTDKNSIINVNKINDYLQALSQFGLTLTEPYIKHIDKEIWELRPIRNRILFACWDESTFIMLHRFMKQTRKTPPKETALAKNRLTKARMEAMKHEQQTSGK
jgi:phage-related protein